MRSDVHERARFLADEALIAGLSPEEAVWLRGHLDACGDCARYAETGASVVRGLHSISFDLDPEMNARVQLQCTFLEGPIEFLSDYEARAIDAANRGTLERPWELWKKDLY